MRSEEEDDVEEGLWIVGSAGRLVGCAVKVLKDAEVKAHVRRGLATELPCCKGPFPACAPDWLLRVVMECEGDRG